MSDTILSKVRRIHDELHSLPDVESVNTDIVDKDALVFDAYYLGGKKRHYHVPVRFFEWPTDRLVSMVCDDMKRVLEGRAE